jgi:hypothetical protein
LPRSTSLGFRGPTITSLLLADQDRPGLHTEASTQDFNPEIKGGGFRHIVGN